MKKVSKKFLAVLLVGVMMFCLTACGVDMDKVKGNWTLSTIGGKDLASFAEASGVAEVLVYTNYTITDKEITKDSINADGSHATSTFTLKQRSDGVEGYQGDTLAISLKFDEKANTLTMKIGESESTAVAYVFVKGTKNLDEEYQNAFYGSGDDEYYEE